MIRISDIADAGDNHIGVFLLGKRHGFFHIHVIPSYTNTAPWNQSILKNGANDAGDDRHDQRAEHRPYESIDGHADVEYAQGQP